MILNNSHNSKKRLFEVFQKVNGVKINETILPKEKKEELLNELVIYVAEKLGLNELPKINLSYEENKASENKSFGGYNPTHKSILLIMTNRNLADAGRTLAHELKHYEQDLKGLLNNESGITGSEEENEANTFAGIIMREFGKLYPEIFE
jgi:Zn-dependent peptidase ImmA (M78 family)